MARVVGGRVAQVGRDRLWRVHALQPLIARAGQVGREPVMQAYTAALQEGYRFLSFGDAMLITRRGAFAGVP